MLQSNREEEQPVEGEPRHSSTQRLAARVARQLPPAAADARAHVPPQQHDAGDTARRHQAVVVHDVPEPVIQGVVDEAALYALLKLGQVHLVDEVPPRHRVHQQVSRQRDGGGDDGEPHRVARVPQRQQHRHRARTRQHVDRHQRTETERDPRPER